MKPYRKLLEKHKQEYVKFFESNGFFAFNDGQFNVQCDMLGVTSFKELTNIGSGGFILRKKKGEYIKMNKRQDKERREFFSTDEGFKEALTEELYQTEYGYTGDPSDGIERLFLSDEELEQKQHLIKEVLDEFDEY